MSDKQSDDLESPVVGIFGKFPEPGKVKTRLGADVGMKEAAAFYAGSLSWMLIRLENGPYPFEMIYAPSSSEERFSKRYSLFEEIRTRSQSGSDLGEKMCNAVEELYDDYDRAVILLGSDAPDLPFDYLNQAGNELRSNDIVLGPAEDGGYYLIGMNEPYPVLFKDMEWSHSEVAEETLKRAERKSLEVGLLPEWRDYDRLVDFF